MPKRITRRAVDALRRSIRPVFRWDTDVAGFGCTVRPIGRKVESFQ
jgi:hypothetical protein